VRPEAIFAPVGVLVIWTLFILFLTGYRRVQATLAGRVPRNAFRMGESADVPPDIVVVNRNYMNLLEAPVLFYVACVALYVTRQVGVGQLVLAWVYVALRMAHTFIHLTKNRVVPRLIAFLLGNLVLFAMWIWFFCSVI
jgi:hypothetical protein